MISEYVPAPRYDEVNVDAGLGYQTRVHTPRSGTSSRAYSEKLRNDYSPLPFHGIVPNTPVHVPDEISWFSSPSSSALQSRQRHQVQYLPTPFENDASHTPRDPHRVQIEQRSKQRLKDAEFGIQDAVHRCSGNTTSGKANVLIAARKIMLDFHSQIHSLEAEIIRLHEILESRNLGGGTDI
ncbi:hypothetical protein SISSUDRAFT_1064615 [Sistotremastrum suecicum HHB10207 ss-3]|uniref:Uncharacterized protein n=1 Tax=Sistotremastrum suecicum HHB10207 ss-3 TaxID=1314776 RepID=A0A166AG49_9AGAM|nr:hypothetical protein SISSUDRAFT_1064615 [Sistotremastrum suecicum HHB10207 ss-3]